MTAARRSAPSPESMGLKENLRVVLADPTVLEARGCLGQASRQEGALKEVGTKEVRDLACMKQATSQPATSTQDNHPHPPKGPARIHLVALHFSPAYVGQEPCRDLWSSCPSGLMLQKRTASPAVYKIWHPSPVSLAGFCH